MSGLAANSSNSNRPIGPRLPTVPVGERPLEPVAERFWLLWQGGQQPHLGRFLTAHGNISLECLLAILEVDQRERWGQGDFVKAEHYFRDFPHLVTHPRAISLILGEMVLCQAVGQPAPLAEYQRRFPEFGSQLHLFGDSTSATISDLHLESTRLEAPPENSKDELRTIRLRPPLGGVATDAPPLSRPTLPVSPSTEAPAVERIGHYQIVGVLARGGMGVIYRAVDTQLKRTVALKMILSGVHADAETFARFRAEAEAVARLQHPNIVQIHQVGEHEGLPYLALEFVDGPSLHQVIAKAPLPSTVAAELIARLARAIDFAHQQGIVHRDLKPGNILLAAASGSGSATDWASGNNSGVSGLDYVPKITDFGLAKLYKDSDTPTQPGDVIGTPNYMAPEQAEGAPGGIGPPADIYSLGAVLYEMLTGTPPFHGGSPMETLLRVRLSALVPPRHYSRQIPADLETICLKCLQKDRLERYASAAALAEDLDRFLGGRPILARPVSRAEQAWKWCRRHPTIVTLAASLAMLFIVANAIIVYQWQNAVAARETIREQLNALRSIQQREGSAQRANEMARTAAERKQYAMQLLAAETEWLRYDAVGARDILHTCASDRRGWEWQYLNRLVQGSEVTIPAPVGCAALHVLPNNQQFAALGWDGTIRVWDLATGRSIRDQLLVRPETFPKNWVFSRPEFNRDGSRLAAVFMPLFGTPPQTNHRVGVWDVATGKLLRDWVCDNGTPVRLTFSADSQQIAWVSAIWVPKHGSDTGEWHGGELRVLDINDGKTRIEKTPPEDSSFMDVAFSWDGRHLALTQKRQSLTVLNAQTGVEAFRIGQGVDGQRVWYLPNGSAIAVLSGHELLFYDRDGKPTHRLSRRQAGIERVFFSPNGECIITASAFNTVRIYETATRLEMTQLAGHMNWVNLAVMSPDNRTLVTCSCDNTIKVWDLERGIDPPALGENDYAEGVWIPSTTFDPTGNRLFTSSDDHKLRAFDLATGKKSGEWVVGDARSLAVSPDGKTLALGFDDSQGEIGFFDPASGTMVRKWKGHDDCLTHLAFNKAGDRLASTSEDGTAKLWDVQTGILLATFRGHQGKVNGVAFHPDGWQIVTVGTDGTMRHWNMATGAENHSVKAHRSPIMCLAISPDGQFLATANMNQDLRNEATEIKIWDPVTGELLQSMTGHTNSIWHLAFSPDSKRLASGGEDTTVKIWDPANGDLLLTLKRHYDDVRCVAFSRDGRRLASCGDDPFVRIWDATPLP